MQIKKSASYYWLFMFILLWILLWKRLWFLIKKSFLHLKTEPVVFWIIRYLYNILFLYLFWKWYIVKYYLLGFSNEGGVGLGASWLGPGVDKSKYNLESSVTPKSLFEPLFWTLFKASLNNALWASSLLSKKSMVALTSLSSICL